MIAEDLLERGLAAAADDYDVPAGAIDRLREHIAPRVEPSRRRLALHRPSRRGWLAMAGAAAVLVIVLAIALGGSSGSLTPRQRIIDAAGGAKSAPRLSSNSAGFGPVHAPSQQDATKSLEGTATGAGTAGATAAGPGSVAGGTPSGGGSALDFGALAAPGATTQRTVSPVPSARDRVVKTGELDLEVPKGQVGSTIDKVIALATKEHGYVADSRTSEGGGAPSGLVTLRVPVAAFDDTVQRAHDFGTVPGAKVLSLETSGRDVTSKYVDLQARIKALKAERSTFLTLLSKATTIGETLAVQQRVTDVQTQVEQLQGQLKVLASQSQMSTLTVTVDQKLAQATPAKPHHKSGLHKAIDRSMSRFVHGVEAIIGGIGPVLLAALIAAAVWLVGRFGYRRLRRRLV